MAETTAPERGPVEERMGMRFFWRWTDDDGIGCAVWDAEGEYAGTLAPVCRTPSPREASLIVGALNSAVASYAL